MRSDVTKAEVADALKGARAAARLIGLLTREAPDGMHNVDLGRFTAAVGDLNGWAAELSAQVDVLHQEQRRSYAWKARA